MARAVLKPYQSKKRYIPKVIQHEQSIQRQFCRFMDLQWPRVLYKSDYSSGLHLTMHQAMLQKSMQSGRGWPDIMIFQPSRGYHGLFIELKREGTRIYLTTGPRKGKLTTDIHIQEQALMLQTLNDLGYFARFGVGLDKSIQIANWYLNPNYRQIANSELL